MRLENNAFILVSYIAAPPASLESWLAYHLALGFDRVILYRTPKAAREGTRLPAFEAAGRLEWRVLNIDVGPPLKSAMVAAMEEGLPETAKVMALEVGEYLVLEGRIADLRPQFTAMAFPLQNADTPVYRTLFQAGAFRGYTGTHPIQPTDTAPLWRDGTGALTDPLRLFWEGSDSDEDITTAVVRLPDGADVTEFDDGSLEAQVSAWLARQAAEGPLTENAAGQLGRAEGEAPAGPLAPVQTGETPANAASLPDWYHEIQQGGATTGFFKRLEHQSLVHIARASDTLVVTFDNLSAVNDNAPDRAPWGYKFLKDVGCAHLGVLAHRKDWYRAPGLIEEMQALRDQGLFAGYTDVLFTGTSMGGFAALAFSSLSPGARVLAFSPQSTLDEAIVPWETRFGMGRMRNWRLPFSDAAFEVEMARDVIVISDPYFKLDQRHVDRLSTPNVTKLKAWYSGHFSPVFLRRAGLLKPVMSKMIAGTLTEAAFYRLYRDRRKLPWYKRSLEEALQTRGHTALAARVGPAFHKAKRGAGD